MTRPFRIERKARNCHFVHVRANGAKWNFRVLLSGDRHIDSASSNLDLQRKHLREAREQGAGVVDVGDVFDAMQGRSDPRRTKGVGRVDLESGNYLDRIVADGAELFAPYADNLIVIARGNHEQSILKACETDLTDRLCDRISTKSGTLVHAGGYGGWVKFLFWWSRTGVATHLMHYFHGSGGGGMMSHGTLATRRIASYTPDADSIVSGHTHDNWVVSLARQRITSYGRLYLDEQHHVKIPSYKDEFGDGHSGWHVERGAPPKPVGAWWMNFRWRDRKRTLSVDFSRAD